MLLISCKCDASFCEEVELSRIETKEIDQFLAKSSEEIQKLIDYTYNQEYPNFNWTKINEFHLCDSCTKEICALSKYSKFDNEFVKCYLCNNSEELCYNCKYKKLYYDIYHVCPVESGAKYQPFIEVEDNIKTILSSFNFENYNSSIETLCNAKNPIKVVLKLSHKEDKKEFIFIIYTDEPGPRQWLDRAPDELNILFVFQTVNGTQYNDIYSSVIACALPSLLEVILTVTGETLKFCTRYL